MAKHPLEKSPNPKSKVLLSQNIFIWFDEKSTDDWYPSSHHQRFGGRPQIYSDLAIFFALTIKSVFRFSLRGAQSFMTAFVDLMELSIEPPNYTTLSRRQKSIKISQAKIAQKKEDIYLVIDHTGLSLFHGQEWPVHRAYYSKRRSWKKLHLSVDPKTRKIEKAQLLHQAGSDDKKIRIFLKALARATTSLVPTSKLTKKAKPKPTAIVAQPKEKKRTNTKAKAAKDKVSSKKIAANKTGRKKSQKK
jgi:hypothetical protein